jgi:hypothetical protein
MSLANYRYSTPLSSILQEKLRKSKTIIIR